MGLQGEILDTQFQEIGKGLAKLDSAQASIGFEQLASTLGVTSKNMDAFVTSLGPDFTNAMYDAGKSAGAIKGEIGDVGLNGEIGAYVLGEYAKSALGVKEAFQETFPVLEEMNEGFQGTFSGMAENAKTMNSLFGGLIGGAASANNLKDAIEGLNLVSEESGEKTGEVVDVYDDLTNQFNLTSTEAQNALGALGAYAEGQVSGIAANYQWLESMVGADEALAQTQTSMNDARTTFIAAAEDMGIPTAAAEKLATQMGLIPGEKFIIVDATSADTANEKVLTVANALADIPIDTTVTVTGLTEEARLKLVELGYTVDDIDGSTATVTAHADTSPAYTALEDFTNTSWSMRVSAYVDYYEGDNYTNPTNGYGANGGPKTPKADGGLAGSARKFAGAGYTGPGAKWAPAGTVHRGEYIFPKRAVDQVRGVPTQDSLGRMMQQHYPNAMAPTVVVQGGGQGGPVDLSIGSIQALAQAVYTQINIDGMALANNVNGQNRTSTRKSSN